MNWATHLYTFWAGRRFLLATAVIGLLIWSFCSTLGLTLDTSLKALMPDSPPAMRQSVDLLDLAPFSKHMLIQLTADRPEAGPLLAAAADELLAGLPPDLAKGLETAALPDLQQIMAFLPALCDSPCLARVKAAAAPERLAESLAAIKTDLAGLGGATDLFWRLDPLALRAEVFGKFPQATGWPMADPFIGYPVSADGRHLLIVLKPSVSMGDTEKSQTLMAALDRLTGELPPTITAQVLGAQRHTAANAAAISGDLTLTMGLALLLILAIYLFLVRSPGAFWLFLTPAVAVMAAAAVLKAVFPTVSGLALGFGAAVLGIAEDYAVHVHYALRRAGDPAEALGHIARPLLMSSLLCVAGFGVLLFSAIPAIRQLAFFSGAAIMVGYVWAVLVLPHCPAMDRPREAAATPVISGPPQGRVRWLWPVFGGLAGLSLLLVFQVPMEVSIRAMGLNTPAIADDQRAIEEVWHLDGGRRVYLTPGDTVSAALEMSGRLAAALNRRLPGSASSLSDLVPPVEKQRANLEAWGAFIALEGKKASGELARLASLNGLAAQAFEPFGAWFFSEGRIIGPDDLTRAGLGPLVDNFLLTGNTPMGLVLAEAGAPEVPPDFEGRFFSLSAVDLERDLSRVLAGEKRLLPWCVFICLAVLFWAFRNVGQSLLAFIPALAGLAAVLAAQLALARPLGLAEAAALPLVICLGADYGIVVVSELRTQADLGAPMAIFVSGLSTIAGVGILILAQHPVLHALGRTVFIGLAAAMPVSILLLPKLYVRRPA